MKKIVSIIIVFFSLNAKAQDSSSTEKKLDITGYIKSLQSIRFDEQFKNSISDNFVHNRINVNWIPSENITLNAQFRNRLFWGEAIKQTPNFVSLLENGSEKFKWSAVWMNNSSVVLHSNTERCYLTFRQKKWLAKIGRQRINWAITSTWNPNDIFNAYNFIDFDYEERPGTDAISFQYLFTDFVSTEIVLGLAKENKNNIAATKFSMNKWGYDMQLLTGYYKGSLTIGAGWAGNIGDAGFKGEMQYFSAGNNSDKRMNVCMESDYIFKNGWYVNVVGLYNSRGINRPVNDLNQINLKLSADNLMPTQWNVLITTAKEITPLFKVNLGVVFVPGTNLLLLLPAISYNVATNLDAELRWQSFILEKQQQFRGEIHQCFLRLKWSY